MIVYRYELPDGGGPFFTKEGVCRINPSIVFNDNTLDAATSIKKLKEWFNERNIILNDNFKIIKYDGEILYKNKDIVTIKKNTAIRIGEI